MEAKSFYASSIGTQERLGESEYVMRTTIMMNAAEITTLSAWNTMAEKLWNNSIAANPDRDPHAMLRLECERPHPWNGCRITDNDQQDIDPLILNTHGIEPFPDNQGVVQFITSGEILRNALETWKIGESEYQALHFLKQGSSWDYARTMTNVSWKRVAQGSLGKWVLTKGQIEDAKKYMVVAIGGCGYVFIKECDGDWSNMIGDMVTDLLT